MNENSDILRKIRALLAKAEDPNATPAEAEALSAKAEELVARYAIDEALLQAKASTGLKPEIRNIDIENPYALSKASLLNGIAQTHACRAIRSGSGQQVVMRVVGFPSDLEVVEVLYTSLLVQATHAMVTDQPERVRSPRAWRNAFYAGFANTVYRRLLEIEARAKAESQTREPGTSLVLVDRKDAVDHTFREAFPRTTTTSRQFSSRGYGAGSEAGARANLGQSGLGRGRRAVTA